MLLFGHSYAGSTDGGGNAVLFGYQRKISDIIYFATAIPAGQNEETDI